MPTDVPEQTALRSTILRPYQGLLLPPMLPAMVYAAEPFQPPVQEGLLLILMHGAVDWEQEQQNPAYAQEHIRLQ